MLPIQGTIHFSEYSSLYDVVVPKDNKLHLINELVDFSFIYDELNEKYCRDNGRMAEDPVRMFKYLMIKSISGLSDVDLVDKCMYDMSYKYFLMKDMMPEKYEGDDLEKQMDYVARLLNFLRGQKVAVLPAVSEKINLLAEMVDDIKDHYTVSADPDARVGHKTADSAFFGYKGHLAVVPERLVVAATMTSGERGDGPELPMLIGKAKVNIPDLKEVIGDSAYSGQNNLEYAWKEGVELVAKLKPILTTGRQSERNGFVLNKDAGMMICPAGHMAIRKYLKNPSSKTKRKNLQYRFIFDAHKCKICNHAKECGYKGGERKEYCITILTKQQEELKQRQETNEFKEKYRERYIVEAKNSELKHPFHLDKAISYGLDAFTMQSAVAIFTSNLVRINRILSDKSKK